MVRMLVISTGSTTSPRIRVLLAMAPNAVSPSLTVTPPPPSEASLAVAAGEIEHRKSI